MDEQREAKRKAFPEIAGLVDLFRGFADQPTFWSENGVTKGKELKHTIDVCSDGICYGKENNIT